MPFIKTNFFKHFLIFRLISVRNSLPDSCFNMDIVKRFKCKAERVDFKNFLCGEP